MKKTFWLLYHERRLWQEKGLPPRVWAIGWATHDSRNKDDDLRYDAGWYDGKYHEYEPATEVPGEGTLPQTYGWIAANFVNAGGKYADGGATAEFATFEDVRARFETWEAAAPDEASVGQSGFAGPDGDYPYELKFNRLLGPGNVELVATSEGRLVFDVHDVDDKTGYNMSACSEDIPYEYPAGTLRAECDRLGPVENRYVQVWSAAPSTVDVRASCGTFAGCGDPWVPVLDAGSDDVSEATFAPASAVPAGSLPSLVLCQQACCSAQAACGDAGSK